MAMSDAEQKCFEHFLQQYKHQYDLNDYYRKQYDTDLEYFLGYRPKSRYPLAYNISFNKLMPRVWQIMSRFMDQLYQPNSNELVAVRPR